MVFSSIDFIFKFLPIFLILYFLVSKKYKNLVLFLGSIFFYGYGEPVFVILIICSIFFNYYIALFIDKHKSTSAKKKWMLCGIFCNLSLLLIFKYASFIIDNLNYVLSYFSMYDYIPFIQIPVFVLPLPIGISFYTFQVISYIVDVYKEKIKAEKSIVDLGTYICMFPQLIAGPIIIYSDIEEALKKRTYNLSLIEDGTKLFVLGFSAKVLIANRIGTLWNDIQTIGYDSISTPLAWIGIIAYTFQIYFDFYGYSLMAKGLGYMLGFHIPTNFNIPYMSKSLTEFWQRWHITLSDWFKNYVYIPLGGNRNGNLKTIRNLFIVWLLTGLWHGASWNFVIWGMFTFLILLIEKAGLKKLLDKSKVLSRIYMLILIPLTWMFFAISSPFDILIYLQKLFSITNSSLNPYDFIEYLKNYSVLFIFSVLFSTNFVSKYCLKYKDKFITIVILLVMFWSSVYMLYHEVNNPFLYFRF